MVADNKGYRIDADDGDDDEVDDNDCIGLSVTKKRQRRESAETAGVDDETATCRHSHDSTQPTNTKKRTMKTNHSVGLFDSVATIVWAPEVG